MLCYGYINKQIRISGFSAREFISVLKKRLKKGMARSLARLWRLAGAEEAGGATPEV